MALRLGQIVESLGGRLVGDANLEIHRLSPLDTAQSDALSFLNNPQYQSQLATTQAGCVIVSPAFEAQASARGACIVADNPYHYFAKLTQLWRQHTQSHSEPRIHPSAVIHPEAHIDTTARIGPLCVVERGAKVGANTWLKSHVTLGEDCTLGARCIVHAGVVIGADGFGFALFEGRWEKIEQLGTVRIGNDVETGKLEDFFSTNNRTCIQVFLGFKISSTCPCPGCRKFYVVADIQFAQRNHVSEVGLVARNQSGLRVDI